MSEFAWLNPEPEAAWEYRQSIAVIRNIMHNRMFPLTIDGLELCRVESTECRQPSIEARHESKALPKTPQQKRTRPSNWTKRDIIDGIFY